MKKWTIAMVIGMAVLVTQLGRAADLYCDQDGAGTAGEYGVYGTIALDGSYWAATDGGDQPVDTWANRNGSATDNTVVFTIGEGTFTGNGQYMSMGTIASWEIGGFTWRTAATPPTTSRNNVGITGGSKTLTFAPGGQIDVRDVYTANPVDITLQNFVFNDFEKIGAGDLQFRVGSVINGTITVSEGQIFDVDLNSTDWTNTIVNLGPAGTWNLAYAGAPGAARRHVVGGLSGSGTVEDGNGHNLSTHIVAIMDGFGSDFSGRLDSSHSHEVCVTKSGTGTQIFSHATDIGHDGATVVWDGTLLVNGTHVGGSSIAADVQDDLPEGDVAYSVSGGVLGGSGTIQTAGTATDAIRVSGTGKLAPGTDGTAGKFTLDVGSATVDLTGIGTGALLFDLDDDTTAGTTYDQVSITAGTLDVTNLVFDDFAFSTLTGFDYGKTFVLFDVTEGITGFGGPFSGTVAGKVADLELVSSSTQLQLKIEAAPPAGTVVLIK